jgi:hypothetical protein
MQQRIGAVLCQLDKVAAMAVLCTEVQTLQTLGKRLCVRGQSGISPAVSAAGGALFLEARRSRRRETGGSTLAPKSQMRRG